MMESPPPSETLVTQSSQNGKSINSKKKRSIVKGPKDGQLLTVKFDGKGKQHFDNLKKTKVLVLISIKDNEFCSGTILMSLLAMP
jgi:hypothetical protein